MEPASHLEAKAAHHFQVTGMGASRDLDSDILNLQGTTRTYSDNSRLSSVVRASRVCCAVVPIHWCPKQSVVLAYLYFLGSACFLPVFQVAFSVFPINNVSSNIVLMQSSFYSLHPRIWLMQPNTQEIRPELLFFSCITPRASGFLTHCSFCLKCFVHTYSLDSLPDFLRALLESHLCRSHHGFFSLLTPCEAASTLTLPFWPLWYFSFFSLALVSAQGIHLLLSAYPRGHVNSLTLRCSYLLTPSTVPGTY